MELNESLWDAAGFGRDESVTNLVKRGADVNWQNDEGVTVLMIAAGNGHYSTVQLLLKMGAHTDPKDMGGRTVLHYADDPNIRNLLLAAGARAEQPEGTSRSSQGRPLSPGDD